MNENGNKFTTTKLAHIFSGITFAIALIVFILAIDESNKYKTPYQAIKQSSPPATTTELTSIPVSIWSELHGEHIVVNVKVKNTQGYTLDETLNIYLENGVSQKRLVDAAYVELSPGETGNLKTSIELDKAGPGPYNFTWEWK